MSQLNWGELISQADDSGGGNYDPLPDGEYELKVIESSVATTSGTETNGLALNNSSAPGREARRLI